MDCRPSLSLGSKVGGRREGGQEGGRGKEEGKEARGEEMFGFGVRLCPT